MKKALVFGAYGAGAEVKRLFQKQGIHVVAFADNAEWKWGRIFEKCPVISPKEIVISQYDIFAIGVLGAVEEIKEQLLGLGVASEKIVVPVITQEKAFVNNEIEVKEPLSNKSIVLAVGGIDSFSTEIKEYFRNEKSLHFDFKNNIWSFQYFIEDCIYTGEILNGENYFKRYPIDKLDSLIIDAYILDDVSLQDILEKENRLLFCQKNYYVEKMLLNKNTYDFYMERLPRPFDKSILENIENLKKAAKEYNLPLEEICGVSGIVLQLYGLRDEKPEDDLDIIMTSRFRELYGKSIVYVSNKVEMHPESELMLNKYLTQELSDDRLITDEECFFRFRGCKFLCLDLLYHQKRNVNRKSEIKLMDYFYETIENKSDRRWLASE